MSQIKLSENFIKDRVKLALTEDLYPYGDITSSLLKENKILILASDQDAKQRGVFVNFFNKPASTPKGVARFHLETGSDIFFISCYVEHNGKHKLQIQPVVPEGVSTVKSITQAFTTLLEKKVREFPEQYFWFHRRWKTMPHKAS